LVGTRCSFAWRLPFLVKAKTSTSTVCKFLFWGAATQLNSTRAVSQITTSSGNSFGVSFVLSATKQSSINPGTGSSSTKQCRNQTQKTISTKANDNNRNKQVEILVQRKIRIYCCSNKNREHPER